MNRESYKCFKALRWKSKQRPRQKKNGLQGNIQRRFERHRNPLGANHDVRWPAICIGGTNGTAVTHEQTAFGPWIRPFFICKRPKAPRIVFPPKQCTRRRHRYQYMHGFGGLLPTSHDEKPRRPLYRRRRYRPKQWTPHCFLAYGGDGLDPRFSERHSACFSHLHVSADIRTDQLRSISLFASTEKAAEAIARLSSNHPHPASQQMVEETWLSAQYAPGSTVGYAATEAIAMNQIQSLLNSFHTIFGGKSAAIRSEVNRVIQLIDLLRPSISVVRAEVWPGKEAGLQGLILGNVLESIELVEAEPETDLERWLLATVPDRTWLDRERFSAEESESTNENWPLFPSNACTKPLNAVRQLGFVCGVLPPQFSFSGLSIKKANQKTNPKSNLRHRNKKNYWGHWPMFPLRDSQHIRNLA